MNLKASDRAMIELFSRQDETLGFMVGEYRSGKSETMKWRTVPAARLTAVWKSAAELGFVRDEKGLDAIAERMIENVMRLAVNTAAAGHTESSVEDVLGEYFEEEEFEAFVDWAIETPTGWRISDYGLDKLFSYAALLTETADPMDRLTVIDIMLNVVHQRSDLASWFVEGGTMTLSGLSDGVRPSDRFQAAADEKRMGF